MDFDQYNIRQVQGQELKDVVRQMNDNFLAIQKNFDNIRQALEKDTHRPDDFMRGDA